MAELSLKLKERSYSILIAGGLLKSAGERLAQLDPSAVLLVTNPTVGRLYGPRVEASLKRAGLTAVTVQVPDTEEAKSVSQAQILWDRALEAGLDRRSAVLALGGGVVGDLAGFAAATYMRGIALVQAPTTLLAQVDSSVGGKTAVNLPRAKNIVGVFHQPALVLADLDTLDTLPPREIRSGLAEVIKYAVIAREDLFTYLEDNLNAILNLNPAVLEEVITRCCAIKAAVVEEDEREAGLRAVLNFGHTVGHALEAATSYARFRHGEAVAIGMVAETAMAVRRGLAGEDLLRRLTRLIAAAGLPVAVPPDLRPEDLAPLMLLDKKNYRGGITMVLPRQTGDVEVVPGLTESEVLDLWPRTF